jgi:hypothetical protein
MKLKQMAMAVGAALATQVERHMVRSGMVLGALALEVDALDDVPEAQRAWYAQDATTKKFKLDGAKVEFEDTSALKGALEKERSAVKEAKAQYKRDMEALAAKYKDIDPEKYREIMGQFDNAEEAELLKKGAEGLKAILEKRTAKLRADYEKKLQEARERESGALEVASTFMDRALENHIREAAGKAGLHSGAVEDALLRAAQIFLLDDDGNAVQYEGEGDDQTVVLGKDGKTPFSPAEWLESMKEKAPHWFPADASGGGARGGKGGGATGKTMKRAAFDQLSPQEKSNFTVKEKGTIVD